MLHSVVSWFFGAAGLTECAKYDRTITQYSGLAARRYAEAPSVAVAFPDTDPALSRRLLMGASLAWKPNLLQDSCAPCASGRRYSVLVPRIALAQNMFGVA